MGCRFIRWSVLGAFLTAGFVLAPIPASAHHGVANFDETSLLTLRGTVSEIEYRNPHVHIYLDVRDAQGRNQRWTSESASPNILSREGWGRNAVKPGDLVEVTGHRAKNGTNLLLLEKLILPSGRELYPRALTGG